MHIRNRLMVLFVLATSSAACTVNNYYQTPPEGEQVENPAPPVNADTGAPQAETSNDAQPTETSDAAPSHGETSTTSDAGADTTPTTDKPDTASEDTTPAPADTAPAVTTTAPTPDAGADTTPTTAPDTGTADTAPADTGAVTPPPPAATTGSLVVHVRLPLAGSHTITMKGYESPFRAGGASWGTPTWTSSGSTGLDATITIAKGASFVLNGFIDGDPAKSEDWSRPFVAGDGTVKAVIWATFEGKTTKRYSYQSNGAGGYNLVFVAEAAKTAPNDLDGDGYTSDSPDPSSRDCQDDPAASPYAFVINPGSLEVPGDGMDFNCDGLDNPARYQISLGGLPAGLSPVAYDALRWPSSMPLIWNAATGTYNSLYTLPDTFPTEFTITWDGGNWDALLISGTCIRNGAVTVRVYQEGSNVSMPMSVKVSSGSGTCHDFVTLP